MVATHTAILTGEPVRAALSKDDISRDYMLRGAPFGAETFTGALRGLVGAAFGGVGGRARGLKGGKEEEGEASGRRAMEGREKQGGHAYWRVWYPWRMHCSVEDKKVML